MLRAEERLVDLAASIADGAPIDWSTAETAAGEREQRIIRRLRLVSNVVELYRSLPDAKGGPPLADAPMPAGPRWGRLVLLDRLGEGTSSEVHRAWDPELQREVALKLLKAGGVEGREGEVARGRLLDEARRLARVRHPHVVIVFGADERDHRVGLWMDFVNGDTLDEIVRRSGPLGAREAALVGIDLCGALAAVHGAGLIHRDVKAQNVMRETGGRTVLMDFGTGEEMKGARGARLAGTPLYLAPEIFAHQAASRTSDLYSLGVLLFYLATGQFPVQAPTFEALAQAHERRDRRRLRDVRPDLEEPFVRVVERALLHDPERRYQSAGEMEAALRQTLDRVPVGPGAAAETPRVRRTRFFLIAAALVVAAAAVSVPLVRRAAPPAVSDVAANPATQIAVLPLADLSGGSAPPYLADALTDQLIATLGQIGGLRVTSRTSVLQFRGQSTPIRDIARRLGVGSVLEGSLHVGEPDGSGDRTVTVNARIISAGTESQVWAGTFRERLGNVRALEAAIAHGVAQAVNVALSQREAAHLKRFKTSNPAAAEAYFMGRFHNARFGTDNFKRAIAAFERATRLDPNYAEAHAGLALAHIRLGSTGSVSQPEARALSLNAVSKAVALDPDLAEAHAGLADIKFYYDWDWEGADAAYQHAIELNPSFNRARTQLARLMSLQARLKDATDEARRAEALDPLSAEAAQTVGLMLYYARDYDDAEQQLARALELDPSFPRTHLVLSRVHEAKGDWPAALAAANRAVELSGAAPTVWQTQIARLKALSGDEAGARQELARLTKLNDSGETYIPPEYLGYVHAALGEDSKALDLLERAVAERDPGIIWLKVDPRLDQYRTLPRFKALVRRIGLNPDN